MLGTILQFVDEQVAAARTLCARHVLPAMQLLQERFALLWLAARPPIWRAPPAPSAPADMKAPSPTMGDQLAHAPKIAAAAMASIERIGIWQSAAADHVDAAEYAHQRMLGELATVMPLPVDGAPLRAVLAEAATPSSPAQKALAA